jgi:hypothetical protein
MAAARRTLDGPAFGWSWSARLSVALQRLIALRLPAELSRLSTGRRPANTGRGWSTRLSVPLQGLIALRLHPELLLCSLRGAGSGRRRSARLGVALQRLIALRPAELALLATGRWPACAGRRRSAGLGISLQRLIDLRLRANLRPAWRRPAGSGWRPARRRPRRMRARRRAFRLRLRAFRRRAFRLAGRRIDRSGLGKDDRTLARPSGNSIRCQACLWNRNGWKQHRAGKQSVAYVLVHLDPCEKA